ncbi:CLUMA_CG007835, isoform A [Clunio marinus]|uniref:CLUMA_CG007835, isoform A n=1 Tax=Clunio marinus TaxID=568069 RepID=A0A1J1I1W9_9DIPT|nr:CLUMA_CG007835, isoform A [Clunio marinus]
MGKKVRVDGVDAYLRASNLCLRFVCLYFFGKSKKIKNREKKALYAFIHTNELYSETEQGEEIILELKASKRK